MIEVREPQRIAEEEDRRVVADDVPVALLGIELEGGAANVAFCVGRAALTGDGREAQEHGRLLPDLRENLRLGVAGDVVGHREGAVGTPALGVHAPLRDYFPVEMRQLLDQPDILQERRAASAGRHDVGVVCDRRAGCVRKPLLCSHVQILCCVRSRTPSSILTARPTSGTAAVLCFPSCGQRDLPAPGAADYPFLQGIDSRRRDGCYGVAVSKRRLLQCHLSECLLREAGLGKSVTILRATDLVLVAAIVPALPQSSWTAIATQLCIGPTRDDIPRNSNSGRSDRRINPYLIARFGRDAISSLSLGCCNDWAPINCGNNTGPL